MNGANEINHDLESNQGNGEMGKVEKKTFQGMSADNFK